jgi:hypothetical protein
MAAFMGMREVNDWTTASGIRPKNWRETVLYLYPNGNVPLTAILALMDSERTDDPEFSWFTQTFPTQAATITGVYTNTGLSSAYVSGAAAGATLYFKMSSDDISEFRVGHQVLCRDASDYTVDVNGKVTAKTVNGASSFLAVKLLEADDNSSSGDLSDCDTMLIIGNVNAEGAPMPDAISRDATKLYNYTQIFRTPLSITRTAQRTRLRTGPAYQKMKKEALEIHTVEMEKAMIFGIPTENVGDNGKRERTTGGILNYTRTYGTVADYTTEAGAPYASADWTVAGETWIEEHLEEIFRYGSGERLALCGSGAILGINALVKNSGNYQLQPKAKSYGIAVMEWFTPFGVVNLKIHPLFSHETTNRNSMLIIEPKNIRYRYIDDTTFFKQPKNNNSQRGRIDGMDEEYLTEAGLEFHHPSTWGFLNGVGENNTVGD